MIFRRAMKLIKQHNWIAVFAIVALVALLPQRAIGAPLITEGTGMVVVPLPKSAPIEEINVWYYRPRNVGNDAPIVFVMHGVGRNADGYRDSWIASAESVGFIVLAPGFTKQEFPSSWEYNLGNIMTRSGFLNAREEWSFSIIESIFDQIVDANNFKALRYDLYGHSAGSQFVHRFVFLMPTARVRTAVAANAGWYTLPDLDVDYPYGMRGTPLEMDHLKQGLSQDLIILLGTADNDPNGRHLRKTPEAMAQGAHRLARGENFFNRAKKAATSIVVAFNWRLEYAADIGHSNHQIATIAASFVGYPLSADDKKD